MDHTEPAGVNLREIAMRELALHHAQRTLAQDAIVRRNPAAADVGADKNSRNRQDRTQHEQANQPTLSRCHYCHFGVVSRLHLWVRFADPYFYAQRRVNWCQ